MNTSFSTDETLAALAQMPFLDSIELAAVTRLPEEDHAGGPAPAGRARVRRHGAARAP